MLENFSMAIELGFPLPSVPQSNSCRFGSMPAKSRLGRFKIAFSALFEVVRTAPLIHKAAIHCTLFRGVSMHCLCRAVHHRANPYSRIGLTTAVYIQLTILGDMRLGRSREGVHYYSFCRNHFAGLLACRHVRQQASGL